jgi:carbonic anhydrase
MTISALLENNRAWAAGCRTADPAFFERLVAQQAPDYLWIGCADSRVPANQIVGLPPGEMFVHRNIANVVPPRDANALSVLQFAVETLGIAHVIVCGHYRCGGVRAALGPAVAPPLERWLRHVRAVRRAHAAELAARASDDERWHRLCELNVAAQVRAVAGTAVVRRAWRKGRRLAVHGWIYDLRDGLLHDLGVTQEASGPGPQAAGRASRRGPKPVA